jgi:hypothetical protein
VACPFFMPIEKLENGAWIHPSRLPLGCGWSGHCTAPGHDGEIPSHEELQQFCNLGYAASCTRLPAERAWDTVRFGVRTVIAAPGASPRIRLRYVCERAHRPADHGVLEFDPARDSWVTQHPDPRLQRMAECFLGSYLETRKNQEVMQAVAS